MVTSACDRAEVRRGPPFNEFVIEEYVGCKTSGVRISADNTKRCDNLGLLHRVS